MARFRGAMCYCAVMSCQKGFVSLTALLLIVLGLAVGGGAYYMMQNQSSPASTYQEQTYTPPVTTQTNNTTETTQTQQQKPTTQQSSSQTLTVHGMYMLRDVSGLKYLGFSLYAEGPDSPLNGVTQLFFNDESSEPGSLAAPQGSSFSAVAGNLRPRPSCDLEIEATVEVKNPVVENRSEDNIGNYRVVSGDFSRLITRGQVTDICPVDKGNGVTSYERTPRSI